MNAATIAQPGDADLDFDVDNITIVSVVRLDYEFMVRAEGGFGAWVNVEGDVTVFEPGDERAHIDTVELDLGFPDGSPEMLDYFQDTLERWQAESTPLRMCCAPGRMASLIEDREHWLPLPRSEPS